MNFNCPYCNQLLDPLDDMLGKEINCPACNGSITIPLTASQPPSAVLSPTIGPSSQQKSCPFCGELILAIARKCKHCGEFLDESKPSLAPAGPLAQMVKEGRFVFACPYAQAYAIVERAMAESEVRIKENTPEKGLLGGNCKYGINPFGITVTATFYTSAGGVQAEVVASFTDAFDTFGACEKKVAQISDRIRSLSMADSEGVQPVAFATAMSPDLPSRLTQTLPPSYAGRAGHSFKGKAITGFFLSVGGLLFCPCSLAGIAMCAIALNGMSTSKNRDGKGMAIAGLIIGIIPLLAGLLLLIGSLL